MSTKRSKSTDHSDKAMGTPAAESQHMKCLTIDVDRSGDWMPAEELRQAAIAALTTSNDMALNLEGIEHLDASAMQVLLALEIEQINRGRHLDLVNASPSLRRWFELAGASDHLCLDERINHA
jgi:anti-anti-sigma factor